MACGWEIFHFFIWLSHHTHHDTAYLGWMWSIHHTLMRPYVSMNLTAWTEMTPVYGCNYAKPCQAARHQIPWITSRSDLIRPLKITWFQPDFSTPRMREDCVDGGGPYVMKGGGMFKRSSRRQIRSAGTMLSAGLKKSASAAESLNRRDSAQPRPVLPSYAISRPRTVHLLCVCVHIWESLSGQRPLARVQAAVLDSSVGKAADSSLICYEQVIVYTLKRLTKRWIYFSILNLNWLMFSIHMATTKKDLPKWIKMPLKHWRQSELLKNGQKTTCGFVHMFKWVLVPCVRLTLWFRQILLAYTYTDLWTLKMPSAYQKLNMIDFTISWKHCCTGFSQSARK